MSFPKYYNKDDGKGRARILIVDDDPEITFTLDWG
jgi:hypothetical protein